MKITKRQLRRIIKEEKAKLAEAELSAAYLQTYKVEMLVAVVPGQEEYILSSIEDGMEFDVAAGEGIIEYSVRQESGGNA